MAKIKIMFELFVEILILINQNLSYFGSTNTDDLRIFSVDILKVEMEHSHI